MHPRIASPLFFASRALDRIETRGEAACTLGHRIARPNGDIDGVFATWHWNGETLTAQNDRYGFFPLFYYCKDGAFGIASNVSSLIEAGANTTLDDAAVALYLRLGQFFGDDTAFQHIRCVPPNATLVWNGNDVAIKGGPKIAREEKTISRQDAIRRYLELFADSIRKRPPPSPRFAVPLSGGRDSRHILFELVQAGFKPHVCVTAVHYPDDAAVASTLAAKLELPHVTLPPAADFFDAETRKNALTSFGVDQGAWPLVLRDYLTHAQIGAIYDGIGGDVLSAGLFLTPERDRLFRSGALDEIVGDLLPDTESQLRKLLNGPAYQSWNREVARARLAEAVSQHLDNHNPVTSFFFWNRTRRKIAMTPYGMLSGPYTVFAPYLDHDVFDFLASLPTSLIMDHEFHTEAIRLGYPEWKDVRFEDKAVPEPDFSKHYATLAARLAERVGLWPQSSWLRSTGLGARLALSRMNHRFAGSSIWYVRPALWLLQLESLIDPSFR